MPFTIEPVKICQTPVPEGIGNELEFTANGTFANIIRQFSNLTKFANTLFGGLLDEAVMVMDRTQRLDERVIKLRKEILQMDVEADTVSFADLNKRKQFMGTSKQDIQAVSADKRPQIVIETYLECTPPPALTKFDRLRDDGKESMKLYTNPMFFFDLWLLQIQKETKQQVKKRRLSKRKVKRQKESSPTKIQSKQKMYNQLRAMGEEFIDTDALQALSTRTKTSHPDFQRNQEQGTSNLACEDNHRSKYGLSPSPPSTVTTNTCNGESLPACFPAAITEEVNNAALPPPPPPPPPPSEDSGFMETPPPPPPPFIDNNNMMVVGFGPPPPAAWECEFLVPTPPAPAAATTLPEPGVNSGVPPPPPPPPPSFSASQNQDRTERLIPEGSNKIATSKPSNQGSTAGGHQTNSSDGRSDLLQAIREGCNLRRVADNEKQTKVPTNHNVQAIMEAAFEMRRKALEESDESSDEEDEDDDWEDD